MRRTIIIVAVVIVGALYFSGRMDHALYPVGLNFTTCGQNAFGAVYCGNELTAYNARVRGVQRQITAIQQQAAQTETAALQSITQAECQADPAASGCP